MQLKLEEIKQKCKGGKNVARALRLCLRSLGFSIPIKDPIIIPLFRAKAFWPPARRASTTKQRPLKQSSPTSPRLSQRTKMAQNLSTKSPSSERLSRIRLTLTDADEHPEEEGRFQHHFRAGFGLQGAARREAAVGKRCSLCSVHPPSWSPLATELLLLLLPPGPSYARAPDPRSRLAPLQHRSSPTSLLVVN